MAMDYRNALAGLASGMAGQGGGEMENEMELEAGDMVPCPLCQGAGQIPAELLMGAGQPAMPPRLAARAPMMGGGMPMGGGAPMPMSPRVSMGS